MRIPRMMAAPIAVLLLQGCGPGFPIITGEQEDLVQNVERISKENEALKKRVSSLESGGGAESVKKELEDLKFSVAETKSSLEDLRRDFSFVQGSVEEGAHAKGQLKEDLKAINDAIKRAEERLAAVEGGSKGRGEAFEALKKRVDEGAKGIEEVRSAVASLEARLTALERRLSSMEAPPAEKSPRAEDPETLYMKGYQHTDAREYAEATEAFERFLRLYPSHRLAGNARYWLGEISYAKGDWEKAILEFDKVIKEHPNSEKVAASMLKQGFAFEKLGSAKEARVLLQQLIDRFPKSPEAGIARKRLDSLK